MNELISFTADGLLIIIVVISFLAALAGFEWKKTKQILPYAIMAGLTSLLVGKFLSLIIQPSSTRPFIEKGVEAGAAFIDNPGFPSDHMLLAVVIVCAVYYLTPFRKLAVVLAVLSLLMGLARVLALVHTPIDIFGGIIAGLSGTIWYKMLKYSGISKLHL